MSVKEFPSNADYTTIVKNLTAFISDSDIKSGKPLYTKTRRLISYAGGYSKVFPIQVLNQKIALRLWTANIEDAQKRYQEIDSYLKEKNISYFVGFNYHHNSLNWKNSRYPFISMDWVEGMTLNRYIDENINDSHKIAQLAESFLEMVEVLHQHNIAHGDLQDGNILVIKNGTDIELKLIDYDSIFVPSLKGFTIEIIGVESYQHPKKSDIKKLNGKIDYFSELVIYLSLLAYAEDTTLWKRGQDQKLLFDSKDFTNSTKSKIFNKLKTDGYSSKIVELTLKLEEFCLIDNIDELLPLEKCIKDRFKEIAELFGNIESIRKEATEQTIDIHKWDKDMDDIKKIFSSTSSGREKIDSKEHDEKFTDTMKKMRR